MSIKTEFIVSGVSLGLGALGTWIGLSKFQSDTREKLFNERKQLIIAEENIRVLRKDLDEINHRMQLMLEKLDIRCDQLDKQHTETQAVLKMFVTQKCEK